MVERYLSLRRVLGFKLSDAANYLRAFAQVATAQGETHVRASRVIEWTKATGGTPTTRRERFQCVVRFSRFAHAEDGRHEVPLLEHFRYRRVRPLPYIYSPDELERLLRGAGLLQKSYPLRRSVYQTLFGLLAATGLRVSEALNLRYGDILPAGVLRIREAKLGKTRLVPLHLTAVDALGRFLATRRQSMTEDDHVFVSRSGRRILLRTAEKTFHRLLRLAGIAPQRARRPRIHDLRHTFATRVLERCATQRDAVERHFVALSTYLGHVDLKATYWYLEATPELMTDLSAAAEACIEGRRS